MKKVISLALILSIILPNLSYSLDKEEFLKFLINTSYPEVEGEGTTNNEEKINDKKDKEKLDNNEEKSNDEKEDETNDKEIESDFIKFHIGVENKPEPIKTQERTTKEETNEITNNKANEETVITSDYIDNIRYTKEEPKILLYHTHSSETYFDSPEGNYHSDDIEKSVIKVGKELTDELEKKGWGIIHNAVYHDSPDYNKSYLNSLNTIKDTLKKNESVEIAIDLHRDARPVENEEQIKTELDRMVTTINGEEVAKIFFVVGPDNKNVEEIRKIANDLTSLANEMYPGIALPVIEKEYGKFNQYLAKNHMLIEIGSNGTSSIQATNSAKYVAEVLDKYFNEYK